MKRLGIAIAIAIIWGGVAEATCHPKLTRDSYQNAKKSWLNTIRDEKDPEIKGKMEGALKDLDAAMAGTEEPDQATCRVINARSEFLSLMIHDAKMKKEFDKERIYKLPLLERAMSYFHKAGDEYARSVFVEEVGNRNEDFISKILALDDNDFTKLMASDVGRRGAHSPLLVLIHQLDHPVYEAEKKGPGAVTESYAYKLLTRFWDRIKKLDEQRQKRIVGRTLSASRNYYMTRVMPFLPEDLRKAIEAVYAPEKQKAKQAAEWAKHENEKIDKLPFFVRAMSNYYLPNGEVGGTVFDNEIESANEDFINKFLALDDDKFTELMSRSLPRYLTPPLHPLASLILRLYSPVFKVYDAGAKGVPTVIESYAYKLLTRFWDRIKKLDEKKRKQMLKTLTKDISFTHPDNIVVLSFLPEDLRKAIEAAMKSAKQPQPKLA